MNGTVSQRLTVFLWYSARYSSSVCPGVGCKTAFSRQPSASRSISVLYPERQIIVSAPVRQRASSEVARCGMMVSSSLVVDLVVPGYPLIISTGAGYCAASAVCSCSNRVRCGSGPEINMTVLSSEFAFSFFVNRESGPINRALRGNG